MNSAQKFSNLYNVTKDMFEVIEAFKPEIKEQFKLRPQDNVQMLLVSFQDHSILALGTFETETKEILEGYSFDSWKDLRNHVLIGQADTHISRVLKKKLTEIIKQALIEQLETSNAH